MLRNSFIFLTHIGEKTEKNIWAQGIRTWEDFLKQDHIKGISDEKKAGYDTALKKAITAYANRDIDHFNYVLPKRQMWRLYPEFGKNAAFLDIETTGLAIYSTVTVVGIYHQDKMISLIQGRDLNKTNIKKALKGASMVCTFNGTMFDLPILEHHYPGCIPKIPHIDLRFVGRQAGLKGGLKSIERQLGISRPKDIVGLDGYEAVRLWKRWTRNNDEDALDRLVRYNIEDVENLQTLADIVVERLTDSLLGGD